MGRGASAWYRPNELGVPPLPVPHFYKLFQWGKKYVDTGRPEKIWPENISQGGTRYVSQHQCLIIISALISSNSAWKHGKNYNKGFLMGSRSICGMIPTASEMICLAF